jgi:site-specific DNA-methyltransferase (adenine-specific)
MKNPAPNQQWLFPPTENGLTISKAALSINVSEATIRNWIKTECLSIKNGIIDRSSIDSFKNNIAGVSKLNSRANKLHFDAHDHDDLTKKIKLIIRDGAFSGGDLSSIYENGLSSSYRNKEGVYYTPQEICEEMFSFVEGDKSQLIFFDPCCGTGNFLLAALMAGFSPSNVYGSDIDETAIEIAKARFREASGCETNNLFVSDFLSSESSTKINIPPVDVLFTNPPWGKKLEPLERERVSKNFAVHKSLDTSGIFLIISRNLLKRESIYGMVLPESFFNVAAFEQARSAMLNDDVLCIIDHGKAFSGLLTKAVSFVSKKGDGSKNSRVICRSGGSEILRAKSSFNKNPKSIVNYYADDNAEDVLAHILDFPHVTLSGRARWALGVVTGNNKLHLSDTPVSGFVPVYKGSDISKEGLKQASAYISTDMSKFQQVAPADMYNAPEKIIYKFISSKIVCYYDCSQVMILNSANLFIPDCEFPVGMKLLVEYLNSDFVNWVFDNLFHTHKILRSDIEKLPIYSDILSGMSSFNEKNLIDGLGIERVEHGSYRVKK